MVVQVPSSLSRVTDGAGPVPPAAMAPAVAAPPPRSLTAAAGTAVTDSGSQAQRRLAGLANPASGTVRGTVNCQSREDSDSDSITFKFVDTSDTEPEMLVPEYQLSSIGT